MYKYIDVVVKVMTSSGYHKSTNSHKPPVRMYFTREGELLFHVVSAASSQILDPLAFSSLFPSINIFVVLKGHLCIPPSLPSSVMNECNYQA